VKLGGKIGSVRKNGGGGLVACLILAPGSGLNSDGDIGGALELIKTLRDQFVAGGRFVGRVRGFGSGLKIFGGLGGGPGLITWLGFKGLKLFVSAASAGATSKENSTAK
jgi:hypothetical protein